MLPWIDSGKHEIMQSFLDRQSKNKAIVCCFISTTVQKRQITRLPFDINWERQNWQITLILIMYIYISIRTATRPPWLSWTVTWSSACSLTQTARSLDSETLSCLWGKNRISRHKANSKDYLTSVKHARYWVVTFGTCLSLRKFHHTYLYTGCSLKFVFFPNSLQPIPCM